MKSGRAAFTLMEALAAAALLGLIAAATMPLLRSLGASGRIQERAAASAWLASRGSEPPVTPIGEAIPDHPDWRLSAERLPLDLATPLDGPSRAVWRLVVTTGDDRLAETVVVLPDGQIPEGAVP